jgi:hypothetical protein
MENLIPIIIAILFFAYKQYNKNTKGNEQQEIQATSSTEDQEHSESYGIDELLSTFIEDKKVKYQENEIISAKNNNEIYDNNYYQPTKLNIESENKHHYVKEFQPIKKHSKKSKEIIKEKINTTANTVKTAINNTETIDFDLRQAVVYDAILNAPYLKN